MFFCENTRPKMSADALGYVRFLGIMSNREDPSASAASAIAEAQ